jgi:hypothetical protein
VIEVDTDCDGILIPFLAGYKYSAQDLNTHDVGLGFSKYRYKPTEPVMVCLTNDHQFRQVTSLN